MTDDRLARLALSLLGEPGDLRMAGLVAELGAARLYDALLRDLDRAGRRGIRWIVPGDAEWPTPLDDLEAGEPLQEMGGVPLGLWVRGPLRLHELVDTVAIVGCRSATT